MCETERRKYLNGRVLLEKLIADQLLKKLPEFYGTRKEHNRIHKSPPLVPTL
jgi:hypothetical protein